MNPQSSDETIRERNDNRNGKSQNVSQEKQDLFNENNRGCKYNHMFSVGLTVSLWEQYIAIDSGKINYHKSYVYSVFHIGLEILNISFSFNNNPAKLAFLREMVFIKVK